MRFLYLKAPARHLRPGVFNSLRRDLHDKFGPSQRDRSPGVRNAGPCCKLLGADEATQRRTDREGVWHRFVWANRGHSLHLQRTVPWSEYLAFMGLGAQDRPSLLRREG